jgi:hypothetical protein
MSHVTDLVRLTNYIVLHAMGTEVFFAIMRQAVRDGEDRVGMDDTKTRKNGRKALSIAELPHSSQNRA